MHAVDESLVDGRNDERADRQFPVREGSDRVECRFEIVNRSAQHRRRQIAVEVDVQQVVPRVLDHAGQPCLMPRDESLVMLLDDEDGDGRHGEHSHLVGASEHASGLIA